MDQYKNCVISNVFSWSMYIIVERVDSSFKIIIDDKS